MKKLIAGLLLSYLFIGCSTDPNTGVTTVVPIAPTNLTATVVSTTQVNLQWSDNATNEAGYKIQRKTSGGNYADIGSTGADIATFSDQGLTPNTSYTYRVYAFNQAGNSLQFSNEVTVNTNSTPTSSYSYTTGPNVTDNNGNVYQSIVTSCGQIWINRNLSVNCYRNGDPIPHASSGSQWLDFSNSYTGAWCWYNDDSANYWQYGKLYNWYAVNDPRGIAPVGWHVPTDVEFNKLIHCIDQTSDTTSYCTNNVGTKMKSTSGWNNNGNGNNISGFSGLPGGERYPGGQSTNFGYTGVWWSASRYGATSSAWYRNLIGSETNFCGSFIDQGCGYSVRIVKD